MRRSTLVIGGLVALAIGTAVAGFVAAGSTDDRPDRPDREHRPADLGEVTAKETINPESRACVIRSPIHALNDDDRVVIEPAPHRDDMKQTTGASGVYATTYADPGDEVRLYSVAFEGPTTIHGVWTVDDDCSLTATGDK